MTSRPPAPIPDPTPAPDPATHPDPGPGASPGNGIGAGLYAALPIAAGYFPIAFAFGVAARGIGLSGPEAFALSLIIYSGAAQFLSLSLIAGGAPVLVSAATLVAMGLRHLLYGPALMATAGPKAGRRLTALWAFGLTDEVFGAALGAMARGVVFSERFILGLAAGAYLSWLAGTALGAYAGGEALADYPALQAGLSFLLPALFLSLLLSIASRRALPVILAAGGVCLGVTLMVNPTIGVLAGMLGGALAGVLLPARQGGADA